MLNELYRILRLITFKRLTNFLAAESGYQVSSLFKKPFVWSYPYAASIEPTTFCNLKCPECISGQRNFSRPTGFMQLAGFKKAIDQIHSHTMYIMLHFQGESFLHPEIFEMIEYTKSKNLYISISTNGHQLSELYTEEIVRTGLDKLIVSMDGITKESYENYRVGGDFDKVISNVKNLVETKQRMKSKTPKLVMQYLVFKSNEHEINQAKEFAKNLGFDQIVFKTAQFYDVRYAGMMMPSNPKYSRYHIENEILKLKGSKKTVCKRLWTTTVISQNCWVLPCCFDKDGNHPLGRLEEQSFKDIWNSKQIKDFRQKSISDPLTIDICQNCTNGVVIYP